VRERERVCVGVRESLCERECVCACVKEIDRKIDSVCVRERGRG